MKERTFFRCGVLIAVILCVGLFAAIMSYPTFHDRGYRKCPLCFATNVHPEATRCSMCRGTFPPLSEREK